MDANIEVCFLVETHFQFPAVQLMQDGNNPSDC